MIEVPQVVTIAGIDSSGGAGINADVKTFQSQKVYSATIVVGLTAQNTLGVQEISSVAPQFILSQFDSVFSDLDISAAKTGALFDVAQVKAVITGIQRYQPQHLVVDPVMVAKGGAVLLSDEAIRCIKKELFPLAELITPNLQEAEVLLERPISSEEEIRQALYDLQSLGTKNVLIKGGHSAGETVTDLLLTESGEIMRYSASRIDTNRTHGTGDTLSSYITAHLAQGEELLDILPHAKSFITNAIKESIDVGHGHGPLNHWVSYHE
ncbi:bifunctional hydroxymethylpyrimidine kinase/phosphomethylpyrimidine kinase [Lactococcus formosensis]|uniref:bifunctional hydroxymethylpyrimidine kinase/phosphomethylpyrimidine kinase n=1 Tax=Lactococcus formosensis TaxID=1281486 RepID=UPI0013FDDFAB|nr:bifunctional hydroxymethylpyrimidine kinase/phosphomethylpyrimidine kinase [Lactococcus formosensis]NHI73673.1 bifunctional hydroxymethylpyrimidine kinase/phosphomethylpyrimidine kinase [Lactococcus garvieae]NHI99934.1 bifunctional hydroxymethylpyrimidine kinase/phosphomethylpyrimidine kinase [Lactococcus garvieae]NHJ18666.1 bifunctional hydroxymethylpyrimidine kinase/phosphomethylpyrimidine kinase [Lactococcus garvieae]